MFAVPLLHRVGLRTAARAFPAPRRPLSTNPRFTQVAPGLPSRCRPRIAEEASKAARQRRAYRQPFDSQRFNTMRYILYRWSQRPTFYYEVAGVAGAFGGAYVYNLEPVPVSGRRRFNIVSPEREAAMGKAMYNQTMQEFGNRILPSQHPSHRMVQRVLDRLIPNSGLAGEAWEIHVIQDDMKNAFVLPGGKVFVFSGILDVCQGEDGLATVLGHEIAHNVAHHAAERMSQSGILLIVGVIAFLSGVDLGISNAVSDLAFTRPGSRAQESEADYIGLLMMAESCYNPEAALGVWARMELEEKKAGVMVPQFLSTHPSSHNRLEKMGVWMDAAKAKRELSKCGDIGAFADAFMRAVPDFARR